jgi:hypothetical protein
MIRKHNGFSVRGISHENFVITCECYSKVDLRGLKLAVMKFGTSHIFYINDFINDLFSFVLRRNNIQYSELHSFSRALLRGELLLLGVFFDKLFEPKNY